jgi:SagB-type dehydrogenase family enzyme
MEFIKERRKVMVQWANWAGAFWLTASLFPRLALGRQTKEYQEGVVKLPPPRTEGTLSVEKAINQRRTVRKFASQPLEMNHLSQLLWAAQGITGKQGIKRSAPSAGALYPMDLYAVVGRDSVAQLETGVYHYEPRGHMLSLVAKSDSREGIARAALSQMWIARAPLSMIITAEFKRITGKYKKRGVMYALIEAGHVGQNLFLQAEVLGLKAGIVGAFYEKKLIDAVTIPPAHEPLLIMPIGYQA